MHDLSGIDGDGDSEGIDGDAGPCAGRKRSRGGRPAAADVRGGQPQLCFVVASESRCAIGSQKWRQGGHPDVSTWWKGAESLSSALLFRWHFYTTDEIGGLGDSAMAVCADAQKCTKMLPAAFIVYEALSMAVSWEWQKIHRWNIMYSAGWRMQLHGWYCNHMLAEKLPSLRS